MRHLPHHRHALRFDWTPFLHLTLSSQITLALPLENRPRDTDTDFDISYGNVRLLPAYAITKFGTSVPGTSFTTALQQLYNCFAPLFPACLPLR